MDVLLVQFQGDRALITYSSLYENELSFYHLEYAHNLNPYEMTHIVLFWPERNSVVQERIYPTVELPLRLKNARNYVTHPSRRHLLLGGRPHNPL